MPIDSSALKMPEFENDLNNKMNIAKILADFDIYIEMVNAYDISLDSREIKFGSVFVAISGTNVDARKYIDNAIDDGAVLVIKDTDIVEDHGKIDKNKEIQVVHFFELAKQIGQISSEFFDNPSFKMHGVAITGTNGKTSIAHICSSLSSAINCKAGSIGTMGLGLYDKTTGFKCLASTLNTTPDTITTHRMCDQLKSQGANRFCIEASSHGLHQQRLQGVSINTAVFSNLTLDHLDYHKSIEEYGAAKRLLLKHQNLHSLVLNIDDPESRNWLKQSPIQLAVCVYSCAGEMPNITDNQRYCWATNIRYVTGGCSFDLKSSWGQAHITFSLVGAFNVSNLLAAMAALLMQDESFESVVAAIGQIHGVPGRMELFVSSSHANIIVDYAHTPDALQQALVAARQHTIGKLIVVFGCGGDRDNSKRAKMGRIAEQWADSVVITQDNSRTEAPESIIADIISGMTNSKNVDIELDRKIAIKQAYQSSCADDLILVAGKGHEEYLDINGIREYYNEREFVNQLTSEISL